MLAHCSYLHNVTLSMVGGNFKPFETSMWIAMENRKYQSIQALWQRCGRTWMNQELYKIPTSIRDTVCTVTMHTFHRQTGQKIPPMYTLFEINTNNCMNF